MLYENFLPPYYTPLFNAVTDALEALEHQNYGAAKALLLQGQQSAEEGYGSLSTPCD